MKSEPASSVQYDVSIMRSLAASVALVVWVTAGSAQQMYRREKTPLDMVALTLSQRRKIDALTTRFAPRLESLRRLEAKGKDVSERRDALNRDYSNAILAVMSSPQRATYMEAVYHHVEDFLATHKGVAFENVFVWGGAYAKKPPAHT